MQLVKATPKVHAEVVELDDGSVCIRLVVEAKYVQERRCFGRQQIHVSDGDHVLQVNLRML